MFIMSNLSTCWFHIYPFLREKTNHGNTKKKHIDISWNFTPQQFQGNVFFVQEPCIYLFPLFSTILNAQSRDWKIGRERFEQWCQCLQLLCVLMEHLLGVQVGCFLPFSIVPWFLRVVISDNSVLKAPPEMDCKIHVNGEFSRSYRNNAFLHILFFSKASFPTSKTMEFFGN